MKIPTENPNCKNRIKKSVGLKSDKRKNIFGFFSFGLTLVRVIFLSEKLNTTFFYLSNVIDKCLLNVRNPEYNNNSNNEKVGLNQVDCASVIKSARFSVKSTGYEIV